MNARIVKEDTGDKLKRLEYPLIIEDETICTIRAYPESGLFERDMMRLISAYNAIANFRKLKIDIPDLPKEPTTPEEPPEDATPEIIAAYERDIEEYEKKHNAYQEEFLDVLDIAVPTFDSYADAVDAFIVAGDKVGGHLEPVMEKIMYEDDETFAVFDRAFARIFERYNAKRSAKTSKYRAKIR